MRFNSPPNWPAPPPGWTPPPGWQPDPSWPAPPPGWQLWVQEKPPRRTGLIIGGIVAALAVIAIVVTIIVVTTGGSEASQSPEDQIRSAITSYEEAWNASDYDAIAKVLCTEFLKGVSEDNFTKTREEDGRIDITVQSIKVDGETATANVVNEFTNRDEPDNVEWAFVREDGTWKRCDVD